METGTPRCSALPGRQTRAGGKGYAHPNETRAVSRLVQKAERKEKSD